MTARLALAMPERDERAITVAAAAERLGCDPTTIRELLRKALLAGIRVGKTDKPNGVRIKLWSIEAWEQRHEIGGSPECHNVARPRGQRPAHNPAHDEAEARLKAWGV